MNISEMLELNERAKEEGQHYPKARYLFSEIQSELGKHFIGIVGPRGVGKTVILKQLVVSEPDTFYLSADTLDESDLFQVARILSDQYKIRTLLVDEIHFCKTYRKDLKKIYDFLKIRLVFTSSVSLSLFESAHDLSRRVLLRFLYPFSFREYLSFLKNVEIPPITISDIFDDRWTAEHMRFNYLFDSYLQGGIFPFALEEPDPLPLLQNICLKVIRKDIPMVSNLRFEDIEKIEKTLSLSENQKSMGSTSHRFPEILELRNIKQNYLLSCSPKPLYLTPSIPKEPTCSKNQKC